MERMEKGERELGSPETPPLRAGVSRCRLGASVRYDGGHKKDAFLTDTLGPYVEWVPVCPEVEMRGCRRAPARHRLDARGPHGGDGPLRRGQDPDAWPRHV
jgi:hypothetical protein